MDEKKQMELAYFRYGVISSLLAQNEQQTLKQQLKELANKCWTLPGEKGVRKFSWGTIESWLYTYRKGGLNALKDKERKDHGSYRSLSEGVRQAVDRTLSKYPNLNNKHVIRQVKKEQVPQDLTIPSDSTLYRYLRFVRPKTASPTKERRSFEAPHSGYLWQTDIMYGPKIQRKGVDGRYRKTNTYLIAILDDHSRLLCHAQFYFQQNLSAYVDTLKTACNKRGLPERLYTDNGKVFLSPQTKRIAAELGIIVLHTGVRDCQAKGKIERLFKTIRDDFLNPIMQLNPPKSLDELNRLLWRWIEQDYNSKNHSAIATSPILRYLQTAHKLKLLPSNQEQDQLFYFEEQRIVKKDGTFSLKGELFETDWTLAGKKINLRYQPDNLDRVHVYFQKTSYGVANPLDRQQNCKRVRTKLKNKGTEK
jgi:transposase InsO family protein